MDLSGISKILNYIYTEKDVPTNISLSLSTAIGLILYLIFRDIYISIISILISFPIIKILIQYMRSTLSKVNNKKAFLNKFSNQEIEAINLFTYEGTATIFFSDIDDKYMRALWSLVDRKFACTIPDPTADPDAPPIGIILSNNIYEFFLKK